jgi:hypothetical protein
MIETATENVSTGQAAMNPLHGFPPRDSSLSPPRYLPKNPRPLLPPIPLNTNVNTIPINTKSPVRRKPLPSNAFSPTNSNSPYSRKASPEQLEHNIDLLSAVTNSGDNNVRDLDRHVHVPDITCSTAC